MSVIVLNRASYKNLFLIALKMNDFEVRANIEFLVKLGWKGTEILEALGKVYAINAPKKTTVYKWVQRLREGR